MNKYTRLFLAITLAVIGVMALSACSGHKNSDSPDKEIIATAVIAEPVFLGSISATYGTTASLEAAEEANVVARVTGIITAILVEEGDYVEVGQVLAQLDIDKLEIELHRAAAKLNQFANDWQRSQKIYDKNLVSSEAFDKVKFQYEAQKAAAALAKLNLENATIRAPISGIIAIRYVKTGNLLKQNASAFLITDLSEIYAIIHIPESEKAGLKVGQLANITVEAAKRPFEGTIKRISPIVDKDSGTIKITVSLRDTTTVLRPGMFSRVSIIYDTHFQTMLVPKESILSQDDEVSVYVIKEGIAYKRNVSVGFRDARYVEILDGIDASDLVITTGQRNLKDKSHVDLIESIASL